jgi:unsaturated chondroitin disaccharide hydrolase
MERRTGSVARVSTRKAALVSMLVAATSCTSAPHTGPNGSGGASNTGGGAGSAAGGIDATAGTATTSGSGGSSGGAGAPGGGSGTGGMPGGSSGLGSENGGTAGSTGGAGKGSEGAGSGGMEGGGTSGTGAAGAGNGGASGGGAPVAGTAGVAGGAGQSTHAADAAFCASKLDEAAEHFANFRATYTTANNVPRSAKNGTVRRVGPSDWTSGFPAGSFWLLYEHTGDAAWRAAAETFTQALSGERLNTGTHDVGFVINNTFGAGHRLTGNLAYVDVVEDAAASLASRFNANVGATRSWDFGSWSFPVIIDNMMNLELFFHATRLGGSASYREMAITHALTTSTNHFRDDMSSYHVVDYDPTSGAVVDKQTNQGVADESAWARGQAWGLYGFAMCYRETEDVRFLAQAQGIADFYTQSPAMPADGVPYFDFDTFEDAGLPDHRDASAGAIAASGLFELARHAPAEAAERYRAFAIKAVRSLSSSAYRAALGQNSHFLLMHSVGNYPQNDEIDVAMNYADYYYLEALLRCAALD